MTAETFRAALRLRALLPALFLVYLSGCASTAEEAPSLPTPAPETEGTAPAQQPTTEAPSEPAAEPAPAKAPAKPLLRPDHPERYTVKKGDTLWDIAGRFLNDPWRWPQLWYNNPQIENPHLIYPGDILTLTYIDGKPRLQVQERARPTVKLSPKVRVESLDRAIPTIPLDAIQAFVTRPRVVAEGELDDNPYLVANAEGRLLTGGGDRVYARGLGEAPVGEYDVVRLGDPYRNPDDREDILGYEVRDVADARLVRGGDPATLHIIRSNFEVRIGDRLMPAGEEPPLQDYQPRPPQTDV
ncbi:MAG TPA: LysM domain-containing protein, partial [Gammaproteobacteria bacterium]|nr:LysM domain-containing protein [Gammaproteobacteria bacterium]